MESTKYKFVFVVLVYKNINVLRDFFKSLTIDNYKIIVVNSYYDDISLRECEEVAKLNDADFIPIENKGYGYGNNIGTKYAMDHYEYDFLILSNSDIEIKSFGRIKDFKDQNMVIASQTIMRNGKHQNPDTPWELSFVYPILEYGYNNRKRWACMFCHICTRLSREMFNLYAFFIRKNKYKIFSPHGSFVIFTKKAVDSLYPFFDERMFLYNEEWYLALKAKLLKIPVYYIPSIEVFHYEGASSSDSSSFDYNRQSFSIFNEWRKYHKL